MLEVVIVWLAAALVLGPSGPQVHSAVFDSKEECVEAQERVKGMAQVLAVSDCTQVTFRPAGPEA